MSSYCLSLTFSLSPPHPPSISLSHILFLVFLSVLQDFTSMYPSFFLTTVFSTTGTADVIFFVYFFGIIINVFTSSSNFFLVSLKIHHPALSSGKILLDNFLRCKLHDFWPMTLSLTKIQNILHKVIINMDGVQFSSLVVTTCEKS